MNKRWLLAYALFLLRRLQRFDRRVQRHHDGISQNCQPLCGDLFELRTGPFQVAQSVLNSNEVVGRRAKHLLLLFIRASLIRMCSMQYTLI